MRCPKCGGPLRIGGTVNNLKDNESYRLRWCGTCGYKFHTVEFEVEETPAFLAELAKWNPKK